ncbi:MAG: Na/Pi symporter, partial [Planctomycetes bacterium]|nr:Na/Pi symporter [Planctomycetota bacterium]
MAILLDKRKLQWLVRLCLVLVMVYFFLAAIQLFGNSVKLFGADTAKSLFSGLENPFAGLAVGILATVLVQSSSVTTSSIVVMVGTGDLQLAHAVPMVMGANIGTSITNTLVSLAHVTRKAEFRRAFAGATVHDMFNVLTVIVFFPLEMATGYLQHGAEWLVGTLPLAGAEGGFKSPIKTAVKWCAKKIESVFSQGMGLEDGILASALCVVALVLIVG